MWETESAQTYAREYIVTTWLLAVPPQKLLSLPFAGNQERQSSSLLRLLLSPLDSPSQYQGLPVVFTKKP